MKFVCDRCSTKYSIADDKVRQKILKIRCKTCGNVITVREVGAPAVSAAPAGLRPADLPGDEFEEDLATRIDARVRAKSIPAASLPPPVPPSVRAAADTADWHMAIEGEQEGPMTRAELVRRLLALEGEG